MGRAVLPENLEAVLSELIFRFFQDERFSVRLIVPGLCKYIVEMSCQILGVLN